MTSLVADDISGPFFASSVPPTVGYIKKHYDFINLTRFEGNFFHRNLVFWDFFSDNLFFYVFFSYIVTDSTFFWVSNFYL